MVKNKKAQGLPMNTVIIAILVIVVLVILIAFFLSGTSSLVSKAKQALGFGIKGTDLPLARASCEQYCENARTLPVDQRLDSAYCNTWFYLDLDHNGEADENREGEAFHYYCGAESLKGNAATSDGKKDADSGRNYPIVGRKTIGVACGGILCGRIAGA